MTVENAVVRDKVHYIIYDELLQKYLLKKTSSDDVDNLKKQFYILEDIYYHLKRETEEIGDVANGGYFLSFFYSILLGVLDVGVEMLSRLESTVDELEHM